MTDPWVAALALALAAGLGGWWLADRTRRRRHAPAERGLSNNYFRGLNYLLTEEQDKAIDLFLQLAEVNEDTIEIHLALGKLFRRRGEFERAIQFHRHIISRPRLSERQRLEALFELGEDYLHAGLLDRAEKLFEELLLQHPEHPVATRRLIHIYQQQKDWHKAIERARDLDDPSERSRLIAHFCCELAARALESGELAQARRLLERASIAATRLGRVALMEGRLALAEGDSASAVRHWQRACELEPRLGALLLPAMIEVLEAEPQEDFERWLQAHAARSDDKSALLALAHLAHRRQSSDARARLQDYLQRHPDLHALREWIGTSDPQRLRDSGVDPELLGEVLERLISREPQFRCTQCGLDANLWHWQCPGCHRWDSLVPVSGTLHGLKE
ncbi:MAG: lipopolysaccharide assembly protein LapB [Wenzhouxiangellaceae bacterium]